MKVSYFDILDSFRNVHYLFYSLLLLKSRNYEFILKISFTILVFYYKRNYQKFSKPGKNLKEVRCWGAKSPNSIATHSIHKQISLHFQELWQCYQTTYLYRSVFERCFAVSLFELKILNLWEMVQYIKFYMLDYQVVYY